MFSVVIPTYNRSVFLHELLETLTLQSFKEFEVLVCDDGSTDETQSIVRNFADSLKVKYFYAENWGGPARPRNVGIRNASFEWICFLDSDDLWFPEKLVEVAHVIEAVPDVDVISHSFLSLQSRKTIGKYKSRVISDRYLDLLVNGNRLVNSSFTVRKTALEEVGGYSEDRTKIGVEDYDLSLKLSKHKKKFFHLKKPLGQYRSNDSSISANQVSQIEKTARLLREHSSFLSRTCRERVEGLIDYLNGCQSYSAKHYSAARLFFIRSILKGSVQIKLKGMLKFVSCLRV